MLGIISKIYGMVVRKRNLKYDSLQELLFRADVPVISIGNLSAGGTGKTPFVRLIAEKLIGMGRKPAVIGRGYKKRLKGILYVSDGSEIKYKAEECGDEMYMLADLLPVPVIAHEQKYEAALKAQEIFDIDSIIIDDGFQHRKLHRDLDILLIDNDTVQQQYLLPKGRLREPLDSIKRADIVCCRADIAADKLGEIIKYKRDIIIYQPKILRPYKLNKTEITNEELIVLKKGSIAVSGIAKPDGFESVLRNDSYNVVRHIAYKDHFRYKTSTVEKIIGECLAYNLINIITTEKDAVKLKIFSDVFDKYEIKVYVLPIIVGIEKGEEILDSGIMNLFGN